MWLVFGFAATGLLIGNLMAFSATSSITSFLGLLFALLGGSLIAFLDKLKEHDRIVAGKLVFALTLGCVCGVYGGIAVREHQLLTPASRRFLNADAKAAGIATDTQHAADVDKTKDQHLEAEDGKNQAKSAGATRDRPPHPSEERHENAAVVAGAPSPATKDRGWYLASSLTTDAEHIDFLFRNDQIDAAEAYRQLLAVVKKNGEESRHAKP